MQTFFQYPRFLQRSCKGRSDILMSNQRKTENANPKRMFSAAQQYRIRKNLSAKSGPAARRCKDVAKVDKV